MSNPLSAEWNDYLAVIREDAHQLLAWSYANVRPMILQAKDENEMTGFLADGMVACIDSPQTPYRYTLYSIHNEKPTSPDGESGKSRPKLDIQVERCGIRPKRYFTFEAKRLRDDTGSNVRDTMRQYLGHEGIGRFLSGRYASESFEAAMLGFIQAHDAVFWFDQLANAFTTDTDNGGHLFATTGKLTATRVIEDFPDERVSVHARFKHTTIQIFHLFIDCQ